MNSQERDRTLVLIRCAVLGVVLAIMLALQSNAANAQTNKGFQLAQAATPAAAPPTDIGKQVTDSLNNLRSILSGITDVASAQAARGPIQEITTQIERYDERFFEMPAEQRTALAAFVNAQMATLNPLFDKVLATPGVADVLKLNIDALRPKLAILTAATPSIIVGGVDIGKQVSDTLDRLRTILSGITDVASAQAARRPLQEVITEIEKFDALVPLLSPEQKTVLAALVNAEMATLNPLFDKVLAIPGVARVLKITLDVLRQKVAILTGAPGEGPILEIVIKEEKDTCIRPRRGQKPDPSCCIEKIRLVRGTATITSFSGRAGNLTEVNTVACISPTGEIATWKSEESILPFNVAAAEQAPGAAPGAPGTPGGAPGAPGGAPGAPGGAPGAPGAPGTGTPPATPISNPGGPGVTPPVVIPTPPTTTPCVNPSTPNAPTCP
jgi:hypothetical protein